MHKTIKLFYYMWALLLLIAAGCTNGQDAKFVLSPQEFKSLLEKTPAPQLIDVRTEGEFEKGFILNAVNINWNGDAFENKASNLDKEKPLFVYCLSGGRSSAAASKLRKMGFTEVYELSGGVMKWNASGFNLVTGNTSNNGNSAKSETLSKDDYAAIVKSDKLVLIDFYADWCMPCKKMEPYLKEIATTYKDKIEIKRINADNNQDLCKALGVAGLPALLLYNNNQLQWKKEGYQSKEELIRNAGLE